MTNHPPRLATFLMARVGQCDPVLLGDLAEEFAARGSRAWYWREAVAATTRAMVRSVRRHPLILLRAIAAYAVLNLAITSVTAIAVRQVPGLLQIVSVSSVLRLPVLELVGLVAILPVCLLAAWTVAALHPNVRVPATLAVIAWWFIGDAELRRLLANAGDPRFAPYLLVHVTAVLEFLAGLLIGGVLLPVTRRHELRRQQS
jgi:hypothetical protein